MWDFLQGIGFRWERRHSFSSPVLARFDQLVMFCLLDWLAGGETDCAWNQFVLHGINVPIFHFHQNGNQDLVFLFVHPEM